MTNRTCFDEPYKDFREKENYHEHRLYLKNQTCCDENSCSNLAKDYEVLAQECNEAFKKHHETDTNGKIIGKTLCSMNEDTAIEFRQKAANYRNTQNEGVMLRPLPVRGPVVTTIKKGNYIDRGGTHKKKYKKRNKNKSKKHNNKSKRIKNKSSK
jgi:hypothetical protein